MPPSLAAEKYAVAGLAAAVQTSEGTYLTSSPDSTLVEHTRELNCQFAVLMYFVGPSSELRGSETLGSFLQPASFIATTLLAIHSYFLNLRIFHLAFFLGSTCHRHARINATNV